MGPFLRVLHSFKFKVTATVTLMVLIAATGVGGVSLLISEAEMRPVLAAQELSLLNSAAAYIDNDLQNKQKLLKSAIETRRGHDLKLDDIQEMLEAHNTLRDEFFNVSAFDMDGTIIANLNDRRRKGSINASTRKYFQDTVRLREGLVSEPFRSAMTNKAVVVVTQPLENEQGEIIAVLVGSVDLLRPSFSGQMDALSQAGGGYLFIVTADGVVVHHPNKDFLLRQQPGGTEVLIDAVLSSPEGWQDDLLDEGVPTLLVHKRLSRVDWTVALARPLRSVFAPLLSIRLRALAAISMITLCAAFFGWVIIKGLLRPLGTLRLHVERIDSDPTDVVALETDRLDEFGLLSRAFQNLTRRREQVEKDLQLLATTDALTGVHNRRMFDAFLPTALARGDRAGQPVGLAMLDIDKFKLINDTHGHAAGDAVLIEFARRLSGAVRATDTVARLAGDEFVVVFEQLSSPSEINVLGQRIISAMAEPFDIGGLKLSVTASVGIAVTSAPHTQPDEVLKSADEALYGVKAAGRNGYAVNMVGAERVLRVRTAGKVG
ncbi:diguanylate cyclase domain-containing protein [Duganella sp. Dugasp56]|uniref:diguanylate cyclase domain-containing protein n=1 Tax=Duganella sp. Dugasp56 TaxID=3243046 RepID=UPI0039AFF058